jgi:hypothetical protein
MNVPGNNFALLQINVEAKAKSHQPNSRAATAMCLKAPEATAATPQGVLKAASSKKRRASILNSDEKNDDAVFVSPSILGTNYLR